MCDYHMCIIKSRNNSESDTQTAPGGWPGAAIAGDGCRGLLGDYLERNLDGHFLVELDGGAVLADFLDVVLDDDELAVYVVTELLECLGNLDSVDATEDCAGRAGLGTDGECYALESVSAPTSSPRSRLTPKPLPPLSRA